MPSSKGKPDKPPGKPPKPPVVIVIPPPEVIIPPTNESHQLTGQRAIPMVGILTPVQSAPIASSTTRAVAATAIGVVAPSGGTVVPPAGAVYIPPATSFTNRMGTWTMVGGYPHLNGAPAPQFEGTSLPYGDKLELVNDDVILWNGALRYMYFQNWNSMNRTLPPNPVVPYTGFATISVYNSTDLATLISAADPPYVGPSNVPDIYELELTDWAVIDAKSGAGPVNRTINPNNAEFNVDSLGIKHIRFTNDPLYLNIQDNTNSNGTVLLNWFLRLGGPDGNHTFAPYARTSGNLRWLVWIEDDVMPAVDEVGVKLSGFTNEVPNEGYAGQSWIKWRLFHEFPIGNAYAFGSFPESEELVGYPGSPWTAGPGGAPFARAAYNGQHIFLKTKRWYCMEERIVLNDIGQANGYGALWLNGNKVYERTDIVWRTASTPNTKFSGAQINVYHGGLTMPNSLMHYRLAKIGVSSSYIGVPAELLGVTPPVTYPTWRSSSWAVGSIHPISGSGWTTANMASDDINDVSFSYPRTWGKSNADIETWNGWAADQHGLWYTCMGGHSSQWSNKSPYQDLRVDRPKVNINPRGFKGSDPKDYPTRSPDFGKDYDQYTGSYPIYPAGVHGVDDLTGPPFYTVRADMPGGPQPYYADGMPSARHNYHHNRYISKKNRVFMFSNSASFSANVSGFDVLDAYDIDNRRYDPAGTWKNSELFALDGQMSYPGIAMHPVTEEVYLFGIATNAIRKWTPEAASSTEGWQTVAVAGRDGRRWDRRCAMVDPVRNRILGGRISPVDTRFLEYINLSTMTAARMQFSGTELLAAMVVDSDPNYGALSFIINPDNPNQYLFFFGIQSDLRPAPALEAGQIFAVDADSGVGTLIANVPAPYGAWYTRVQPFTNYGGVVFQAAYEDPLQFLVTR